MGFLSCSIGCFFKARKGSERFAFDRVIGTAMRYLRYNEPKDPELWRISKVLPDRWLDERWPQQCAPRQGRWQGLRTSQLVRAHLLALIKRLTSFNRACRELDHNLDFRRFCRLRATDATPTAYLLSAFRERFGMAGWTALHQTVLRAVCRVKPPLATGVLLVDATDLPAAVRRTDKKKMDPHESSVAAGLGPAKGRGRRRAARRFTSTATRSIRFMAFCHGGRAIVRFPCTPWFGRPMFPSNA